MAKNLYLGIDTGSVSTNIVLIDESRKVLASLYLRTHGDSITATKTALEKVFKKAKGKSKTQIEGIKAVCTTGSARNLIGKIVGADVVKNEITCHAIGAMEEVPDVKTVIEIGGQDSKIILLKNRAAVDFNLNTVCASGCGSFLDQQAQRLGIAIERFGELAMKSNTEVIIRGRCGVFAETDMIHKQQLGYKKEDIIKGLCEALVRNYLNNVGKNKEIKEPIVFQGGVAANIGIKHALEKILDKKIIIPNHFNVLGALGAAIVAQEHSKEREEKKGQDGGDKQVHTKFKGPDITKHDFKTETFTCKFCSNFCEITKILENGKIIAHLGSRCGRWE